MATRRSLGVLRHHLRPRFFASSNSQSLALAAPSIDITTPLPIPCNPLRSHLVLDQIRFFGARGFCSRPTDPSDEENDSEEDDDDAEDEGELEDDADDAEGEGELEEDDGEVYGSRSVGQSGKSAEEMRNEAKDIGYEVIGQLDSSENPFKPYEPVFAVVQIGSHQFKVSNGDSIFTERLKYCDVNDKLILNKVMMLGSKTQTIIGRPTLPDAVVHAVVEEHALDAKVIIFKKKRRKNYRRTKGHRQELTKLRITDIQGVDKSESVAVAA